jgi:hypothetical protein
MWLGTRARIGELIMDRTRVLAIAPFYRGFGYVVLERPVRLIDWGVAHVGRDKNTASLRGVAMLNGRYDPDAIVLEDCTRDGSRRSPRVRLLLQQIHQLCLCRGIAVYACPRRCVHETFASAGASTKHQIACVLARRFPELWPRVPPLRKCWMSEDWRINIFDALALALASL